MSSGGENPGGKGAAEVLVAEAKRLVEEAAVEQEQLDLLDPMTAEEMALAHEQIGPNAQPLAVLKQARENRKGRKPGSRNRRTDDFAAYLGQFGPDPAIALMRIVAESEDAMVARSAQIDPVKRKLSWADARSMRIRAAEALLPYFHGKQPVRIDATIRGIHVIEQIGDIRPTDGQVIDGAEIVGVALAPDDEGDER